MTPAIIERIRAEASNSNAEICGALIGDGTAVIRTLALANRSTHTQDSFYIPATEVMRIERAADLDGHMVMGFYHSHPHGDAVPSITDVLEAVPGYVYWIVSRSGDVRAWRLRDDRTGFDEVDVVTRGDD